MLAFITFVHVAVALLLVLIVLVQGGKGAELGAGFGGASQTVFGSTGGSTFFSKFTAWLAAIFMVSSLTLAYLSAHRNSESVIPKKIEQPAGTDPSSVAPATEPAAPIQESSEEPK